MEILRGTEHHQELFAVLRGSDAERVFDLPDELPERFASRIRQRVSATRVFVDSICHQKPVITDVASLARCGIWLCKSDADLRGGVADLGVVATASVFGIPLSFRLATSLAGLACASRVVYHGTAEANFEGIARNGFLATFGQLGTGVYLGSFWKACRFAGRDQAYTMRKDPLVFRVLVCSSVAVTTYPKAESACGCELCSAKPRDRAAACAHDVVWKPGSCGSLQVGKYNDGTWITKNEEWVYAREDIVRIAEAVRIDRGSIAGPHYDPLQRDVRIL